MRALRIVCGLLLGAGSLALGIWGYIIAEGPDDVSFTVGWAIFGLVGAVCLLSPEA